MYKANIKVTLRPAILDPQGKAARHALSNLGFTDIDRVRMGKFIEMWIDLESEEEARQRAREACQKLLANPVMEDFSIELEKVESQPA